MARLRNRAGFGIGGDAAAEGTRERERFLRSSARFPCEEPARERTVSHDAMDVIGGTRESSFLDFVDSSIEQAQNNRESFDRIAAPYVQEMRDAGYSESQARHYGDLLAANAERMAPMYGMEPAAWLESRLQGIQLIELNAPTQDDLDARTQRAFARQPLAERDPLLALVWGRLDGKSLSSAYNADTLKEITRSKASKPPTRRITRISRKIFPAFQQVTFNNASEASFLPSLSNYLILNSFFRQLFYEAKGSPSLLSGFLFSGREYAKANPPIIPYLHKVIQAPAVFWPCP